MGHFADECRSGKGGMNKSDDEAYMAQDEDSDSDQVLLMAITNSDDVNSESWYLDTGCSNHMTGKKEWLLDIDASVKHKVKFADSSTILAEGVGQVMIKCKSGKPAFVTDVLYVPSMKNNLLSLGQLLEKGFTMNMEQNFIEVFDSKHKLVLKTLVSKTGISN